MRTAICTLVVSALLAGASQGAYLYPWAGTPTLTDPIDGAFTGGRDITTGIWYAKDASFHYFRMDLRDTPSPLGNNYAGMYGIFIDSRTGGADWGQTDYIPTGATGIDYIVDSHFNNSGTGTWEFDHYHHTWNGFGFSIGTVDAAQKTENTGKTLEWKIARNKVLDNSNQPADEFFFVAATLDVGSSAPTYDLAPGFGTKFYVPEPVSLSLLALGSLLFIRRR